MVYRWLIADGKGITFTECLDCDVIYVVSGAAVGENTWVEEKGGRRAHGWSVRSQVACKTTEREVGLFVVLFGRPGTRAVLVCGCACLRLCACLQCLLA